MAGGVGRRAVRLRPAPRAGRGARARRAYGARRRGRSLRALERTLLRYQNRTIDAAQVILELIEMAKRLRDAPKRGDALGLTEDELAFYDALADHGGVRDVMGDGVLAAIAHDLVEAIRGSVNIDWTQKEAGCADMRRKVKRLLRKQGYPPDKQENAVTVVIEQAERVCKDWARVV
jgi:type I restriction enzyme R subunit